MAQDAPSTRMKITRDRRTDGLTDTPPYRDATAHIKSGGKGKEDKEDKKEEERRKGRKEEI